MPLQETSPNIINKSPIKQQPGSVISSKKRLAGSPVSLQRESVRLKVNKPESTPTDFDSTFGTTEAEIELNYRNWLLERRLQQANEMKDFLILEQKYRYSSIIRDLCLFFNLHNYAYTYLMINFVLSICCFLCF